MREVGRRPHPPPPYLPVTGAIATRAGATWLTWWITGAAVVGCAWWWGSTTVLPPAAVVMTTGW